MNFFIYYFLGENSVISILQPFTASGYRL